MEIAFTRITESASSTLNQCCVRMTRINIFSECPNRVAARIARIRLLPGLEIVHAPNHRIKDLTNVTLFSNHRIRFEFDWLAGLAWRLSWTGLG